MKFFFFLLITFFFIGNSFASTKNKILDNLKETKNITFNFKQKIEQQEEMGKCVIDYPKKIYCTYIDKYNKVLVSDGNSLVIKSNKNRFVDWADN